MAQRKITLCSWRVGSTCVFLQFLVGGSGAPSACKSSVSTQNRLLHTELYLLLQTALQEPQALIRHRHSMPQQHCFLNHCELQARRPATALRAALLRCHSRLPLLVDGVPSKFR